MSCCCFLFIQPATPIKTNCQGCMREMLFDFSQESSADPLPIDIRRRWMSRAAIGNLIFEPHGFGFLGFGAWAIAEVSSATALRSWRIIGRDATRQATVLNPARANVEAIPV